MSRAAPEPRSEFELLCERCGYSIEGLPREGACPECGVPVAESLPEARAGSPWQRGPGVGAWLRTGAGVLLRPRSTMREIRVEGERSQALRSLNVAVAAGLMVVLPAVAYAVQLLRAEAPYTIQEITGRWAEGSTTAVVMLAFVVPAWVAAAALLHVLTWIEARGIRFFGRVHRSRITPMIATAITAHASFGWVAGGVLVLHELPMSRNVGTLRGPLMLSPILLPMLAAFLGMLWFETVTYLGVLNCRFANRSEPGVSSPVARLDRGAEGPQVQGESNEGT